MTVGPGVSGFGVAIFLIPGRPDSAAAEKKGDFSAAAEVLRLEYHFEIAS
jgi:hypothetical protein